MNDPEDLDVINAMIRYGGSFVSALGQAWLHADAINAAKLKRTFPEYWAHYRELTVFEVRERGRPIMSAHTILLTDYRLGQLTDWIRRYDEARSADDFATLCGSARVHFDDLLRIARRVPTPSADASDPQASRTGTPGPRDEESS